MHRLTPLHFLKKRPKLRKKHRLTTPLQFLKSEPKLGRKKHRRSPLQFLKIGSKFEKKVGLTNPFTLFENLVKIWQNGWINPFHF